MSTFKLERRQFNQTLLTQALLGGTGVAALGFANQAQAQTIELAKIYNGFLPGGTVDTVSRRVADKLRGNYANNVVVENKSGAGGQIAVTTLKDSPPDGSTLLLTPASMLTIYPNTYRKLPYKPFEDVTPVTTACYLSFGLAVGPAVPESVKNVKDLLAWFKANPALANYGSPAPGSMPHLVGALLEKISGVETKHIAYRGSAPGIQDVLGGQLAAFSSPIGDSLQHIKSGKLRVLAVSGSKRSPFVPDVPTYAEQGFAELVMREWYGFFLPGKARQDVVQKAFTTIKQAMAQKDIIDGLAQVGLEAQTSVSPEAFAKELRADHDQWTGYVKRVGFTADS